MDIAFTNYDHTLKPFRYSSNEAEIIQLLHDGWFPINDDETPIIVSELSDGTLLLDGETILQRLNPSSLTSGLSSIPWWGWALGAYVAKRIFF